MFSLFAQKVKENVTLEKLKENIKNNPSAWTLALLATGKTLLDNYWVFTAIPLGVDGSGAGVKLLYLTAQVAMNGGIGALVGNGIDHVRQMRPGYQQIS